MNTLKINADQIETTYLSINGRRTLVGIAYLKEIDWFNLTMITPRTWIFGHNYILLTSSMILDMLLAVGVGLLLVADYSFDLRANCPNEIGRLTKQFVEIASAIQKNRSALNDAKKMLNKRVWLRVSF